MVQKKKIYDKMFGLLLLTAPIFVDATTYTWDSTSSSDLNTAGNWTPSGGPPGSSDDAEFDSTISGVVKALTTVSGTGFSVATIDFTNAADVFSFEINNGTLTFNGTGIGSAIPSSLTNTTVNAVNLDNTSGPLMDQILFSGNPSSSGSATLIASNSGTTTNSTASSAQISLISPYPGCQIRSPNFFNVTEGSTLTATNTGTNHFNASSLQVGYINNTQILFSDVFNGSGVNNITVTVSNSGTNSGTGNSNSIGYLGNPQINIVRALLGGNNLTLYASNMGNEDSTGTGSENIGYVGDNQIELDASLTAGNNTTLTMTNTGTITSNVTGNSNQVGLISGNQLYVAGTFFSGNSLTISSTNSGTNNGSGSNFSGVIQGTQQFFGGGFNAGTSSSFTASNTATNTGSGSTNNVGVIQGPQFATAASFTTGTNGTMTVSNSGVNSATGSTNLVGEVQGPQVAFGGSVIYRDNTVISVTNSGVDSGAGASNQIGYLQNQQLIVAGAFTAGNSFSITASNSGVSSNSGTGSHAIGYLGGDQISFNNLCTVGDNATFTISNTGVFSGSGDTNQVGFLGGSNQITTSSNFTSGNTLNLTISNTGIDDSSGSSNSVGVLGYQCSHDGAFTTGDNTTITLSNTGVMGGSGTGHTVAQVADGQFTVGGAFQAGNSLVLNVTNAGTDTTTGAVTNSISTNFGQQILIDGAFTVGDNATITASNKGTNSNASGLGSVGYLSGQDQMTFQNTFSAGANLTLTATNNAEGVANGGSVGACNNQINFQGTCTLNDGSIISVSNEGFGRVGGFQIYFAEGFTVASGKVTIQASNSSDATVAGANIFVTGSGLGGDANMVLSNATLHLSPTSPFTIGALNGDSLSIVESNILFTIDTDSGVSATFDGVIKNITASTASFVKSGLGTQILSGSSTFTGGATIDAGILILNGAFPNSDVLVNSDGTLKGIGTVGGTLTVDGTVSPGNSIGTLHAATYVQNIGSFYDVEVSGSGESDLIAVTGTATINGGTLVATTADGTYKFQNRYTILSAGTRIGAYSGVSAISSMIKPTVTYDAEHVYLTLQADILSVAETFNERAVAYQLDAIVNPTPLQNILLSEIARLSPSEGESALNSISGWQYTNQELIAESVSAQFINRLYDPIRCIVTSDKQCCACGPCTDTASCCDDFTVWTEVGGTLSKINGDGNSHTFTLKGWEATAGIQKTFICDVTIGLAGSFEHDLVHYRHSGGSSQSNTWLAGLYGLYRPSYFYTFVDFAYGYSFNQMNRAVHVGSLSYKGKGQPDVSQFTFYGELGVDCKASPVLIQPFLGVGAGSYWQREVNESNLGGWGLHVDKKSGSLVSTRVGTHLTIGSLSGKVGSASLDLSWNKRWSGRHTSITEEFENFGEDFVIKGVHLNSNSFYYALTLAKCINEHWKVHVKGEGNVWNHAYQFDGLAGVEYSW